MVVRSFFVDITPRIGNGNGDSVTLGTVRYEVTEEILGCIPFEQRDFLPLSHTIRSNQYGNSGATLTFQVAVSDAEAPQPMTWKLDINSAYPQAFKRSKRRSIDE